VWGPMSNRLSPSLTEFNAQLEELGPFASYDLGFEHGVEACKDEISNLESEVAGMESLFRTQEAKRKSTEAELNDLVASCKKLVFGNDHRDIEEEALGFSQIRHFLKKKYLENNP